MIQLIREAQSEKGFSQVILLGIVAVLILTGAGGFLLSREKKMPSSEKEVREEPQNPTTKRPLERSYTTNPD